jgi:CheY-like chemotaxis protein
MSSAAPNFETNRGDDGESHLPTARARILLAEDDLEMSDLLNETLLGEGYAVTRASNGLELLEQITRLRMEPQHGRFFDVDLIISDIRMPWVSGLEMLKELRTNDRTTPVILITAFGDEQVHMQALRQGACAVLDKPFDLEQLVELVRRHTRPPG